MSNKLNSSNEHGSLSFDDDTFVTPNAPFNSPISNTNYSITYPPQLPVSARKDEIAQIIKTHQVVIISGATGSGKTTQLPKICLEIGRGTHGRIGHTQPRRIAARSVAQRIAQEIKVKLGEIVGYQVRFTSEVGENSRVKLMTDGILLAEIQNDPQLRQYDTLIIDEAHERSINIDFILGYLANILPQRPDLKVIITSATIDSERFSYHFGRLPNGKIAGYIPPEKRAQYKIIPAPVIEVSGRTYPVQILYRPLIENEEPIDQTTGIVKACRELMSYGDGDILVFLSGEGEIIDATSALTEELGKQIIPLDYNFKKQSSQDVQLIPLFARLSSAQQHRIFEPHNCRRIVLATNIAETSLTVPGIKYVVDAGTARISRYSTRTKVQRLPIEPISQASANQRAGRCGRLANGIAIRLYSEDDFNKRDEFTEPEIIRTSLASVIIQMTAAGLGEVEHFPFVDPPEYKAIRDGIALLEEIGALTYLPPRTAKHKHKTSTTTHALRSTSTPKYWLTKIGKRLATLPLDPRLGRMIIAGQENGCASEVIIIVAALSVQDVRERPVEMQATADQLHARFVHPTSDFIAYLNIWRYLRTLQRELSNSAFRRTLRKEFLNYLRFREWEDVVAQLRELSRPLKLDLHPITLPDQNLLEQSKEIENYTPLGSIDIISAVKTLTNSGHTNSTQIIDKSLLVGLLSNLGSYHLTRGEYEGARGTFFTIWPGSGLYKQKHEWVMAAELVETSKLFARTVAKIDPTWVEPLAKQLLRHSYSNPVWSSKRGCAMMTEKVMLYGLTIIADRPVNAAKSGPAGKELAREMFIRHALVEQNWREAFSFKFMKENQKRLEQAYEAEKRSREIGLVADEEQRFEFFNQLVPTQVIGGTEFRQWYKHLSITQKNSLVYPKEFLLSKTLDESAFPDVWVQNQYELPIIYEYIPGTNQDGITIQVPLLTLPTLENYGFDWLVPGLRKDLVIGTIRALPKRVRRLLVPAPQTAETLLKFLQTPSYPQESFQAAFTRVLAQEKQLNITNIDWEETKLPTHLRINFEVYDENGKLIGKNESLPALQKQLSKHTEQALNSAIQLAARSAIKQAIKENRPPNHATLLQEAQHLKDTSPAAILKAAGLEQEQEQVTKLPDVPLAKSIQTQVGDLQVKAYPTLVEEHPNLPNYAYPLAGWEVPTYNPAPTSVAIRLLPQIHLQSYLHTTGVQKLVFEAVKLSEQRITTRWNSTQSLHLSASPYPNTSCLIADLQRAAVNNLLNQLQNAPGTQTLDLFQIRHQAALDNLATLVKAKIEEEIYQLALVNVELFKQLATIQPLLQANQHSSLSSVSHEVSQQLKTLVYPGFIAHTPGFYLRQLPRYVQAMSYRLQKAQSNLSRDLELSKKVTALETEVKANFAAFLQQDFMFQKYANLVQARWLCEEYRVSQFAQPLGTSQKVSPIRIRKLLLS